MKAAKVCKILNDIFYREKDENIIDIEYITEIIFKTWVNQFQRLFKRENFTTAQCMCEIAQNMVIDGLY